MDFVPVRRRREMAPVSRFHSAVNDLFDRFMGETEFPALAEGAWVPAIDIADREDAIVLEAEVPGLKAEDIELSVHGRTLCITGQKSETTEQKREDFYHTERHYGQFRRSISLPSDVDIDKIRAQCHDGVLTVTLPKAEAAKARTIKISE